MTETKASEVTTQVVAAIRRRRRELNWTQTQLADAVGMKRSVLGHLENGFRESITLDEICALAEAMGVAPASLLPAGPDARMSFEQAVAEVTERYSEAIRALGRG